MSQKEILAELRTHLVENIDDYLPFPKPYMGKNKIRAIVLGADPSTDDKIRFDTVFNLGGKDRRYFAGIEKNLNRIGLSVDDVYVQNFCQNYFTKTTYNQRKNWWRASAVWTHYLKEELDGHFDKGIPLLVTSDMMFRRLIVFDRKKNSFYYNNPSNVPVESDFPNTVRAVFPFFRHWKYNLKRAEWEAYKNKLKDYFKS